jgi:hypothetical protein
MCSFMCRCYRFDVTNRSLVFGHPISAHILNVITAHSSLMHKEPITTFVMFL